MPMIADLDDKASELPDLTPRQQRFVDAILEGRSGADAVRASQDTSNWSPGAIQTEAWKLRNHPAVVLWLEAARQASLGKGTLSLVEHMNELERLKEIAVARNQLSAAMTAELARGKVAGHHVDRIADVSEHHAPEDTLKKIAQHNPELAADLAAKAGIPWHIADEPESRAIN